MPLDPHAWEEDDKDNVDEGEKQGRRRRFKDFDCPSCNANNPYDEPFGDGDEILCFYCGEEFKVQVNDDGRLRLRES